MMQQVMKIVFHTNLVKLNGMMYHVKNKTSLFVNTMSNSKQMNMNFVKMAMLIVEITVFNKSQQIFTKPVNCVNRMA